MKTYLYKIVKTKGSFSGLMARIFLGIVIFPHGAQKILGIWGGKGLEATVNAFSQWFDFPSFITVLIALGEFAGSLLLVIGLLSRFAAASIILIMLGAIYYVVNDFFFMNWYGTQKGEGFEYHLLVIGLALVVFLRGSGSISLDQHLMNVLKKE